MQLPVIVTAGSISLAPEAATEVLDMSSGSGGTREVLRTDAFSVESVDEHVSPASLTDFG